MTRPNSPQICDILILLIQNSASKDLRWQKIYLTKNLYTDYILTRILGVEASSAHDPINEIVDDIIWFIRDLPKLVVC